MLANGAKVPPLGDRVAGYEAEAGKSGRYADAANHEAATGLPERPANRYGNPDDRYSTSGTNRARGNDLATDDKSNRDGEYGREATRDRDGMTPQQGRYGLERASSDRGDDRAARKSNSDRYDPNSSRLADARDSSAPRGGSRFGAARGSEPRSDARRGDDPSTWEGADLPARNDYDSRVDRRRSTTADDRELDDSDANDSSERASRPERGATRGATSPRDDLGSRDDLGNDSLDAEREPATRSRSEYRPGNTGSYKARGRASATGDDPSSDEYDDATDDAMEESGDPFGSRNRSLRR
jgi:hypothetical protein